MTQLRLITRLSASLLLLFYMRAGVAGQTGSRFSFSANQTKVVLANNKKSTQLTGNVVIISDQTEIRANQVLLYGADFRYAECSGEVTVTDNEKGFLVRCQSLFFDRETEISRIKGYAEMEDQKNNLTAKGFYLENYGKQNYTIIQIGVRILKVDDQDTMACRAEYARYDREKDFLELSGIPIVHWNDDQYKAARISINLETDEITLDGQVQGEIYQEKESDATETPKAGPQP